MHDLSPRILEDRARQLVERVASGCEYNTLGSATVAIYDTAWVSLIAKEDQWLFPECFRYVLENQSSNGGWESSYSFDDDLLNTLAALLALIKHAEASKADSRLLDLETRIRKATSYLDSKLRIWDVNAAMHVGFEILVPALLSLLESDERYFKFPGRRDLNTLNRLKMERFDEEAFYKSPNTQLHSLEGLIGQIDFDRLGHHTNFGSMMASPASTAAYLIHSSTWDVEAERYIRTAIAEGAGRGRGGVPSVFPMPVFESTWVLTTLLRSGYQASSLGETEISKIVSYLENMSEKQNGLFGFAPSVLVDADDTAKAQYTLSLLGRDTRPDAMIQHFKTNQGYFRTYLGERNASLSANCNALIALLHSREVEKYTADIAHTAEFLCNLWWRGEVDDKWNVSPQYSKMLLAEALFRLLQGSPRCSPCSFEATPHY